MTDKSKLIIAETFYGCARETEERIKKGGLDWAELHSLIDSGIACGMEHYEVLTELGCDNERLQSIVKYLDNFIAYLDKLQEMGQGLGVIPAQEGSDA